MDKCSKNKKPFLWFFSVCQEHRDLVSNVAKVPFEEVYDLIVECVFCSRKTILSTVPKQVLLQTLELFPKAFKEEVLDFLKSRLLRGAL